MVIIWSIPARQDLRNIHQYIARDSKRYANYVTDNIVSKVEVLSEFPYIGKIIPEIGEENVR